MTSGNISIGTSAMRREVAPIEIKIGNRIWAVSRREEFLVHIRDPGTGSFEECLSQGKDVGELVITTVLATQHRGSIRARHVPVSCDNIDVEPALGVNPSGIDHIERVRLVKRLVMGIDLQHVRSISGQSLSPIMEHGHVVVSRHVRHCQFRDMDTRSGFPRENLGLVSIDSGYGKARNNHLFVPPPSK